MMPTYHVRYSVVFGTRPRSPADIEGIDLETDLAGVLGRLPRALHPVHRDLKAGQPVHWTRWPAAPPGFGA